MKNLLPPAFAVFASTAGTVIGCHLVGMPPHDLKIAGLVAFGVSFLATLGAVLASQHRARPTRSIPHA